jgi:hypothetical protein
MSADFTFMGRDKNIVNFRNRYEVNENTILTLKGEFRSAGKIKSILYFGLHCFREDGAEIIGADNHRVRESHIIKSFDSNGKRFTLDEKPSYSWENDQYYQNENNRRYLGIYFDGKINHLPDYLIKAPAYYNFIDNNINLKTQLPKEILDKIAPDTTRIMNHYGAGYLYCSACGVTVPENWTKYESTLNGFSEFSDAPGKFRLGTKKVSPLILPNYGQNEYAILEARNVEINIKDKPKIM